MEKKFNRILSLLLALVMVIGFVPMGHVHAEGEETTDTVYRWELGTDADGNAIFDTAEGYTENKLTKHAGSTFAADGTLVGAAFTLTDALNLDHDVEWSIEWETDGTVTGFLFSEYSAHTGGGTNNPGANVFLWSRADEGLGFGTYRNASSANAQYFSDLMGKGVYHLYNDVVTDEDGNYVSNMLFLDRDGDDIEAQPVTKGTDNNYVSTWDINFKYIGISNRDNYKLNGKINYIEVTIPAVGAAPHECDYTIEGEHVDGDCQTKGYTVMKCTCGESINVEDENYGDHTYAWVKTESGVSQSCSVCEDENQTGTYAFEKVKDATGNYYIKEVAADAPVLDSEGSISADGVLSGYYATFANSIELKPTEEWTIEWKASGEKAWGMILSQKTTQNKGNQAIFIPEKRLSVCVNHYTTKNNNAYVSVTLADYADSHIFTLKNELVKDELGATTNEIKLYIDDNYIGTMTDVNNGYINETTLVFNGIGTSGYPVRNMDLDYIMVRKGAEHEHSFTQFVETVNGEDCQSAGYDVYKCATCEATEQKVNETAVGDHVWGEEPTNSTTGADCQTPGKDTFTCSACEAAGVAEPATKEVDNEKYGAHTYGAWSNSDGVISRSCATCGGVSQTATYVWQIKDNALVDVKAGSAMSTIQGSINNGILTGAQYKLNEVVTLPENTAWSIELSGKGAFTGMILSTTAGAADKTQFLHFTAAAYQFTSYKNTAAQKQFISFDAGLDRSQQTLYRFDNVLTETGEYEVYATINGGTPVPVNTNGFLTGDITFGYIGNSGTTTKMYVNNLELDYLAINIPATEEEETPVASAKDAEGNVTEYEDLNDALAHSGAASVALLADQSIDELTVPAGVVLDLNGKNLTTNGVWTNGAGIIGDGKLIVAKKAAAFTGDNAGYLPVYDTDGFVFAKVEKVQTTEKTADNKTTFYFLPEIDADMHEAILAGKDATGLKLRIDFSWTANNGANKYTYSEVTKTTLEFTDEHISQFLGGYADGSYKYAFKLGVSGVDKIDAGSLEFTAWFEANGVKYVF